MSGSTSITPILFTFHYVSIKSALAIYSALQRHNLHSTMYLLNPRAHLPYCRTDQNLHSTMYLLNPSIYWPFYLFSRNLHSTMYLLNPFSQSMIVVGRSNLHSTMYLLNRVYFTWRQLKIRAFTFHYVSIKSSQDCYHIGEEVWFTFHYVSIKSTTCDSNKNYETIYIPLCIY